MYNKAIELQPKETNAYVLLANLYTNFNHLDEAMALYKKVLTIKPNDAEVYMLLGNAHYLKGETETALGAYKSAMTIAPENDEYKLIYVQVLDEYVDQHNAGEAA